MPSGTRASKCASEQVSKNKTNKHTESIGEEAKREEEEEEEEEEKKKRKATTEQANSKRNEHHNGTKWKNDKMIVTNERSRDLSS